MLNIALMISNGSDTNRFRNIAKSVASQVAHLFYYDLEWEAVAISEWDYRLDNPGIVPAGGLSARSLSMVERSQCLLAILGPTVPKITSQEIKRVFQLRQSGSPMELWMFLNPKQLGKDHHVFLESFPAEFGEDIRYSPYTDALTFQSLAFKTLTGYVIRQLRARNPVSDPGSGRI